MCMWMAWVGAAVAASVAHKRANAENAISEYQGRVDANNAQIADWQAADAKSRGDLAVDQNRRRSAAIEGSQLASMAARGLDVGSGSPNAILTDTDFFGAYDESIIRANSRREAWAHEIDAQNYRNDALMLADQRKQNNPFVAGGLAFVSQLFNSGQSWQQPRAGGNSLLTSSQTVAPKWYGGTNGSAGTGTGSWYG